MFSAIVGAQDDLMFIVSRELAQLARELTDTSVPAEALPQLDLTSTEAPSSSDGFRIDLAQKAIGERFIRLLGTVMRNAILQNPHSGRVEILSSSGAFPDAIQEGLAMRLGLHRRSVRSDFFHLLAQEFSHWLRRHDFDSDVQGVQGLDFLLDDGGTVYLRCPKPHLIR